MNGRLDECIRRTDARTHVERTNKSRTDRMKIWQKFDGILTGSPHDKKNGSWRLENVAGSHPRPSQYVKNDDGRRAEKLWRLQRVIDFNRSRGELVLT